MSVGFIDADGLLSGGLGIVDFFKGLLPEDQAPQGTTVNIKVGISRIGDDVNNLGGKFSAVYGFNILNEFIGQANGQKVAEGDSVTFTIDQSSPGEQASFVGISNAADATCISWIAVGQRDDTPGGAWTGDIGAECLQRWHVGNQKAGKFKDSNVDYIPRCTWVDSDYTDGTVSAAMKFRTSAYGENVQDTVGNNDHCAFTIFGKDDGSIAGQLAKRSDFDRPEWIINRLITSDISSQLAKELCYSNTSWGPDFIGADGYFCEMSKKKLLPLCSTEDVNGCIEYDATEKTILKRSTIARCEVKSVHKSYETITHNSNSS
ncbi:hypothetical protein M438DRAFT_340401 [Aureobasidium pullulans EXF-150]|uniref:Uncharacterized protein n=1 Tax=Aureobasidium pullulans EXF-150 TaxID=1043002 RepID=A0A074WZW8_AURPU|nr:uncharacterized protein M438DRAFT_340401 [Aureobasidium pullulans EXF-150]KEQ78740.1 hypothetical protein M438DRAFT_340401 [Aureobasidium pullulans EXF-150]